MDVTAWGSVPVQVITTSIWRMTSLSLTTRKPSMLHGHTQRHFHQFNQHKHSENNVKQELIIKCLFGINIDTKTQLWERVYWWSSAEWKWLVTHHACSAQMGSISVMHTMAPRAFKAVQQPFPTYTPQESTKVVNRIVQHMQTDLLHSW